MVTEAFLVIILVALGIQRLWECRLSLAHEQRLRSWGAVEHAKRQVPVMVALHVAWFIAVPLEVFLLHRHTSRALFIGCLLVFALGQVLRIMAMRALGVHWTIKVITLPGSRAVSHGPFRRIRHPNYLGVWLETVSLPLAHGAWLSACVFGLAQAVFLAARIRAEEAALRADTDYGSELYLRPRFVPRAHHGQV